MPKAVLTLDVEYDAQLTDPESLASAADRLLATALSLPGILADYGDPQFGEFLVATGDLQQTPRWVLYDLDADVLLSTRLYGDREEAVADAQQADDILVLPLVVQGISV